jgi:hypothetical protein
MHRWGAGYFTLRLRQGELCSVRAAVKWCTSLFAAIYPDHMLESRMGRAIAKTAAALYNDDPMHKRMVHAPAQRPWLRHALRERCQGSVGKSDLEAMMNVPVLRPAGEARDKLEERACNKPTTTPDYQEVINDFYRYNYDYNTMYSQ